MTACPFDVVNVSWSAARMGSLGLFCGFVWFWIVRLQARSCFPSASVVVSSVKVST